MAKSRTAAAHGGAGKAGPYHLFMLVLCIYALAALAAGALLPVKSSTRQILAYADTFVCAFFFIDFLISLGQARERLRYLYTWGWIDLLSSIPVIHSLRWGRALRIFRIVRLMRGLRAGKTIAAFILERRAQGALLAAIVIALLLAVFGSIGILHFETAPASNIKTPEDAIWWAIVTMTTVGYGDLTPVTLPGRALAAVLMVGGVGLFGAFAGFVASWLLGPTERKESSEIDEIREELRAIRRDLADRIR